MNAVNHMIRRSVEHRAATPPVVTHLFPRITDPGRRYVIHVYDATHVPARGVLVDARA